MGASFSARVDVQLAAGVWTDISSDVLRPTGIRWHYGVDGNGPLDCVASTGELEFALRNDAGNSGGTQGWYSPLHASVRTGWTYGIPVRLTLIHGSATILSVSGITRSGSTATATSTAHGLVTGQWVLIAGADQVEYNGVVQVTVTGVDTFTFAVTGAPATPATGTITAKRVYVKFRGKIREIAPDPGRYGSQRVHVAAYDGMADLMDADVREVTFQSSRTEAQLLTTLLDSLPATAQPVARSLDTGVDTFPYAFDNLQDGVKAAALIKDIVASAYGYAFVKGDGTFVYQSRRSRAVAASQYTFTADSMHGLAVPSSIDSLFNRVRSTIHPKTIDAAATTVLWAQTGTAPVIAPGETVTIWGTFQDPGNTLKLIGASTIAVGSPAVTTDYTANDAADGSGTDRSASLTVTATAFASTVKFVVTNNYASGVYLTKLQIRGAGVYDNGPRTFEAYTAQSYGDRPIDVDLPYQDSAVVGRDIANYIQATYVALSQQISLLEFLASDSSALMDQALAREPADVVTVSETVTGVSAVLLCLQRIEGEIAPSGALYCRWGLAPAAPYSMFRLSVDTLSGPARLGF